MKSDITIGNDIAAMQHAYENKTKLIINRLSFPPSHAFNWEKEAWALLYTKLMLDGKVIGGDAVKKIKITNDILYVVGEFNYVFSAEFHRLDIFSDENIVGLPPMSKEINKHRVVDTLKPVSCIMAAEKKKITTNDSLVRELHIIKEYASAPPEIYSISFLSTAQLSDFSYSDTMVKFKSEELLESNGYVGNVTPQGRAPIALETIERVTYKFMDKYPNTDKIKFFYGNNKY